MILKSDPTPSDDFQQWVARRIEILPYVRMSGMTAISVEKGRDSLLLPARSMWCGDSVRNRIHTGAICALADTACGFAAWTSARESGTFATLDLRMDYLRSADAGQDLVCDARCHRLSRSVAFVGGEVRQGGSVIALANATFMHTARSGRSPSGAHQPLIGPPALNPLPPEVLRAVSRATHPALPAGRSPYVDFLGVVKFPQAHAGPIFRLPYHEDLIGNPKLPAIHGGVLAGFSETVMMLHLVASNPDMAKGVPKAVDFSIDYLRPARPVDTYAQGITIRLGHRVSLVQANLWQDDPQRPVATTRGHWLMPQAVAPRPEPG
ncbi:MAG: hotdog domain-containing protein [Holophaga sp.]|nr:hotdog domain-containing protein [Holophaga sp.]